MQYSDDTHTALIVTMEERTKHLTVLLNITEVDADLASYNKWNKYFTIKGANTSIITT